MTADAASSSEVLFPDQQEFRRALSQFATGVTVVTAISDAEPVGVAANSFTSVSLDPPLVLFCVAHTSTTWPRIEAAGRFAVNILGDHQEEICQVFARSGIDRFSSVEWSTGVGGSPVLRDTIAYLDCELWSTYDGGDHVIVVGRVVDLGVVEHTGPLLFFRGRYGTFQTRSR